MKKICTLILMMVLLLNLTSCSLLGMISKDFTVSDMTITLTNGFVEKDVVNFTTTYQSTNVVVFVLEEYKTQLGGVSDLDEYIELILEANMFYDIDYKKEDSYVYYEYEKEVSGKDYYYYARAYETEDSFWLVQFACFANKKDKLFDDITKYADSIVFEE